VTDLDETFFLSVDDEKSRGTYGRSRAARRGTTISIRSRRLGTPMFERLLKIRYITVAIVIFAVLHALAFLVLGAESALAAYTHLFDAPSGAMSRAGVELLHSLDFLFVSMVLIVMALGIAKLFLLDPNRKDNSELPSWLQIESISELKVLLWETILTTLLILALSVLTAGVFTEPNWTILLLPAATLLLALSLHFMKKP
jgi:uncharacterized membrane protein YqhA